MLRFADLVLQFGGQPQQLQLYHCSANKNILSLEEMHFLLYQFPAGNIHTRWQRTEKDAQLFMFKRSG